MSKTTPTRRRFPNGLTAGLDYAERRFRVLPIWECVAKGRCACRKGATCSDAGKHPHVRGGCHAATSEPTTIREWWDRWPTANVGIALGSGVVVLDVDMHDADGRRTLTDLEAINGTLPGGATVATGGGGMHRFFRAPSTVRTRVVAPGVELKAAGSYVVAPPSRHRSGQRYNWTTPLPDTIEALPEIPTWLTTDVSTTPTSANGAVDREWATSPTGRNYPPWFPDRLTVGIRNRMLTRFAGWLRGCGYSEHDILAELRMVVAAHVEQPPDDSIDDAWVRKLAHTMASKPITRFGLWARYKSVAHTWEGRAGRTDRHVLRRAVLPIVARHRKLHGAHHPVPIPSLTAATMADVGDRTASRSLRRLREVRRVLDYAGRRTHVEDAQRYRLNPPPESDSRTDEGLLATHAMRSIALSRSAKIPHLDVYRDIFLPRGLGPAAEDVFKLLSVDVGQSAATVSKLAPCHISTAYRVLDRMAGHGLVSKGADGWRRLVVSPERLLEIATTLGVLGKITAGKARRQVQRLLYHSPASQKRRQRDAAIRVDLQKRLLALADTRGWPKFGGIAGESAWRVFVKRTRTRGLWSTLRLLTRQRRPARATPAAPLERGVRRPARGRSS